MMKIKMKRDADGSEDGATIRHYSTSGGEGKDGVYTVSDALGKAFVTGGEAEDADAPKQAASVDKKGALGIPGVPGASK